MATPHGSIPGADRQRTAALPARRSRHRYVVALIQLIGCIDDRKILERLEKYHWTGRPGHPQRPIFRAYLVGYALATPSTMAIIGRLRENPALATSCGFTAALPSRWTFNRFFKRLATHPELLTECIAALVRLLKKVLPELGTALAVDSTTVNTNSNPNKRRVSDPDASWTATTSKSKPGAKEWVFGYKLHILTDTKYEIPIGVRFTTANSADSLNIVPLLHSARETFDWFSPKVVTADKGYDALHVYKAVIDDFGATPIIPLRSLRPGATKRRPNTGQRTDGPLSRDSTEWRRLYRLRTAAERVNSRLKSCRRLERHHFRGLSKIQAHALLAVIVSVAIATCHAVNGETLAVRSTAVAFVGRGLDLKAKRQ